MITDQLYGRVYEKYQNSAETIYDRVYEKYQNSATAILFHTWMLEKKNSYKTNSYISNIKYLLMLKIQANKDEILNKIYRDNAISFVVMKTSAFIEFDYKVIYFTSEEDYNLFMLLYSDMVSAHIDLHKFYKEFA